MKTKLLSLFAISALLFSACNSHGDEGGILPEPSNAELRIGSSLKATATPGTRAFDTTWETSDAIGIYVVETALPNTLLFGNSKYIYDNTTPIPSWVEPNYQAFKYSSGVKPVYPVDNTEIELIAYYPYNSGWSTLTGTQGLDVTTQTTQSAIDLLYAPITAGSYKKSDAGNSIDLNFIHKLSKLIINVKAGTDVTDAEVKGATASLKNFYTNGTFLIKDGTVAGTTIANITPIKTDGTGDPFSKFEAILIPQNFTTTATTPSTVEFKIAVVGGDDTFVWDLKATLAAENLTKLEEGMKYTYTITVNRKGLLVDGIIAPWVDKSGSGVAE